MTNEWNGSKDPWILKTQSDSLQLESVSFVDLTNCNKVIPYEVIVTSHKGNQKLILTDPWI